MSLAPFWYYLLHGGKPQGPVSLSELRQEVYSGDEPVSNALVSWWSGVADVSPSPWMKAADSAALQAQLSQALAEAAQVPELQAQLQQMTAIEQQLRQDVLQAATARAALTAQVRQRVRHGLAELRTDLGRVQAELDWSLPLHLAHRVDAELVDCRSRAQEAQENSTFVQVQLTSLQSAQSSERHEHHHSQQELSTLRSELLACRAQLEELMRQDGGRPQRQREGELLQASKDALNTELRQLRRDKASLLLELTLSRQRAAQQAEQKEAVIPPELRAKLNGLQWGESVVYISGSDAQPQHTRTMLYLKQEQSPTVWTLSWLKETMPVTAHCKLGFGMTAARLRGGYSIDCAFTVALNTAEHGFVVDTQQQARLWYDCLRFLIGPPAKLKLSG